MRFSQLIPQSLKNIFYHFPKALFAVLVNGFPAKKLTVIGVTGSDGKTTTTHLLYHILNNLNYKVAMVSTVEAKIGQESIDTGFHVTSPDPFLLQKLLRKIANSGFTHVVLEATSHGLDQYRFLGTNVKIGILTNITHEHLDYHKTYGRYVEAKANLFTKATWAILNKDDKSYQLIRPYISKSTSILTYGMGSNSIVKARNVHLFQNKSEFIVQWGQNKENVNLPIPGRHNIQNALAAIAAAGVLGSKLKQSASALSTFQEVRGRLNQVNNNPDIYIDFAHTPNALEQVLGFLKNNLRQDAKLIAVFGCAGERDFQKRPMMGKISARLANISIFTAEDPRSESLNKIINQMAQGAKSVKAIESSLQEMGNTNQHIFIREPDRQKAINLAIKIARAQDVIVITGKGHEKSINLGHGELSWSDFDAVKTALN